MSKANKCYNPEVAALVERHAAVGTAYSDIAMMVGLTEHMLKNVYGKELQEGKTKADFKLKETAYQMAVADKNTAMAIFLLKARCGYRETSNVEVKNTTKLVLFGDEPAEEPENEKETEE